MATLPKGEPIKKRIMLPSTGPTPENIAGPTGPAITIQMSATARP